METANVNAIMIPKSKPCHKKLCETTKNKITVIAIGALIGFLVCMAYLIWFVISKILIQDSPEVASSKSNINNTNETDWVIHELMDVPFDENGIISGDINAEIVERRQPLYVGVLTLETHLATRATACNETWGQNEKISKLEFYAEIGKGRSHHTNVVEITEYVSRSIYLPSYVIAGQISTETSSIDAWHTEKSFLMLESICANHIDEFDWFLRTVDDSYINVDNLRDFLDNLDKSQELLLGHPTLPIDDSSYTALNGRNYCLGGPGLIFSRTLLRDLCPSLKTCRSSLSHLPADVAIAKCVSDNTGAECAFILEMQNYFVHSFEKNQFHLLNQFVNAKEAFSYHPLKSDWMMRSLHRRVMKSDLQHTIIQLEELELQESYMEEMMTEMDDLSYVVQNDSPFPGYSTDGSEYTTFYTRDRQALSSESCLPGYDLVQEEIAENNVAEHFARTSVQWGHYQSCQEVLSTYHTLVKDKSFLTVDMICTNLSNPGKMTLARSVMYKTLEPPSLLAQKHWKTSNYILIIVEAVTSDLKFIDFVLRVGDLAREARSNIVLNVIDIDPRHHGNSQSEKNDENSKYYLDKYLQQWFASLNIHLNVYKSRVDKPLSVLYSDVVFKLSKLYPDGTVLFTSVNLQFDKDFILRCRTIVRAGVRVYNPLPVADPVMGDPRFIGDNDTLYGAQNLERVLKNVQSRPLCIHIKDFIPERRNNRNRRNKHKRKKGPLMVNSAFDSHLKYI